MDPVRQSILIVDDSRFNIRIMKDILGEDYRVVSATSGKQALALIKLEDIDLILLDVVMPELDGYEVCKMLKQEPQTKNIPVIFVSAMEEAENEAKGLEIGAIDYIIKPFNPAIIKARVKNHLELKKYRDILENLSLIDGLTQLPNRRYLDDYFDKEWKRALRNGDLLSIILLDIDFFKKYNDYYGHCAGDDCLRRVGKALKDSAKRAGDLVARYGGEEFVVVVPSTSRKGAWELAEKMRVNIELQNISHKMSEVSEHVTISIGVATVRPDMSMAPISLIQKADAALYKAKCDGRNRVRCEYIEKQQSPETVDKLLGLAGGNVQIL